MTREALGSIASTGEEKVVIKVRNAILLQQSHFPVKTAASRLIEAEHVFRTSDGTELRTCLLGSGAVLRNLAPFLQASLGVGLF